MAQAARCLAALVLVLGLAAASALPAAAAETVDLGVITVKNVELAQSIRAKLKAGAGFESLAREHSVSPTASRGGRLGRVPLNRIRPEYRAAIKGLADNVPSKVVPTEEGYTILMRFGAAPAPVPAPAAKSPGKPAPSPLAAAKSEERYLQARQQIMAGLEAMVAGNLAEGEKAFSQALGLNPHESTAPFLLEMARAAQKGTVSKKAAVTFSEGFLAMAQGDGQTALAKFRQAAETDPKLWQAKLFLGNLLAGSGQADQAKALWEEVTRLNPKSPLAYISLGMMARDQGKIKEAVGRLKQALALDPDQSEAHYTLGGIALYQGNFPEAERRFRATLVLDPFNEDAANDLGLALAYQGKFKEAEESYEKALELNPNYVSSHVNLGTLYAKQGKLNKAVDEFTKALNLDPGLADAHSNLAAAYILLGNWDLAIKHADAALGMNYPVPQVILDKLKPHRKAAAKGAAGASKTAQ